MIKNSILFTTLVLVLFACSSKDETTPLNEVIEVAVDVIVQDDRGNDLLNPNVLGHFNQDDIRTYLIKDGEEIIASKGVKPLIFKLNDDGLFVVRVFTPNYTLDTHTHGESITLLRFSENIVDTIKAEWRAGPGYFANTKIWYNGVLQNDYERTNLLYVTKQGVTM